IGAHQLAPNKGATHARNRVGRGNTSGHGTYSCKGLKGQSSRSGKPPYSGFEGGQMPIFRRMHTLRGFNNKWRTEYQPVNLTALERFPADSAITPESLRAAGVIKHLRDGVKVLGVGELTKKLNVTAHAFSASARDKIEKAGGTVTVIDAPSAEKDS
ncbi:MAG: 50S ribosomal protein L15, partial [Dehalococcoidia bacterium]